MKEGGGPSGSTFSLFSCISDAAALCQGVNVAKTECPELAAGITFPARCLCSLKDQVHGASLRSEQ